MYVAPHPAEHDIMANHGSKLDEVPRVSIVVPTYNEEHCIEHVLSEVLATAAAMGPFEVIVVDDGSSDTTAQRVERIDDARVSLYRLRRRCGKSRATRVGVTHAQARWIATLDGDGQNDPADLACMLTLAESDGTSPLIAGVRRRRDDATYRHLVSRVGNGVARAVLGGEAHDLGCGVKVFERETYLALPTFEGMHRLLPALFAAYGHSTRWVDVNHRSRLAGVSKYSTLERAVHGVIDVLGVRWLCARTHIP
jgi:dolichol-phosphate mannosyltransferase